MERTPVTQGSLRVKTEEELQGVTSCGAGGPTILTTPTTDSEGIRSGLPCREVDAAARNTAAPFLVGGRRTSPPPEDWKPLDKCYFCLDGKLPHDDQPPLVSMPLSFALQRWLRRNVSSGRVTGGVSFTVELGSIQMDYSRVLRRFLRCSQPLTNVATGDATRRA